MDRKIKLVLGVILLISLVFSYGGWHLRTGIEEQNKTVLTAVDYRELWKTASNANADMDLTLQRLYDNGVRYIGVKEISLRDLAFQGQINIQDYGQFRSFNQVYTPQVWEQAIKALQQQGSNPDKISPSSLVLVLSKPETYTFLKERLGSRYNPEQIISFQNSGNYYFIINAELTQMDKRKEAKQELDALVGFDLNLLNSLQAKGFSIVLRPDNNKGPNLKYLDEYDSIVSQYGVKYLLFSNEVPGAPDNLEKFKELVNKHQLIIGVIETPEQLLYIKQSGLDQLMAASGYPVNRVYSSTNDDFVTKVSERYYRWVRAVIDRGIRMVYVSPFKDAKKDASVNLNDTIDIIGQFNQTIAEKGFTVNQKDLTRLPNNTNPPWQQLMVALSLLAAGTLYLGLLFKLKPSWIYALLVAGAALLAVANLLLPLELSKVYALGAAILYPSLSSLLLMIYLRDSRSGLFVKLLTSLLIVVGVNMIGAYTIISSLSDIRYVMNLKEFTGVKLSFMVPLMLFVLNYFRCFAGQEHLLNRIWKAMQQKPSYLVLFIFVAVAAAGYYYLGRSGNNLVQVSSLEIKLRELLEGQLLARPRFKEMLVGYPALFAAVYLYHKYRQEAFLFILGLGIVMGSISMVNSFCHVFTAASISIIRTAGGLVLGSMVGISVLLAIWLLDKAAKQWAPGLLGKPSTEKTLR